MDRSSIGRAAPQKEQVRYRFLTSFRARQQGDGGEPSRRVDSCHVREGHGVDDSSACPRRLACRDGGGSPSASALRRMRRLRQSLSPTTKAVATGLLRSCSSLLTSRPWGRQRLTATSLCLVLVHGAVAAHGELLGSGDYPNLLGLYRDAYRDRVATKMFGVSNVRAQAPPRLSYRLCTSDP